MFDRQHCVDTAGFVPASESFSEPALKKYLGDYAPCRPSTFHQILANLENVDLTRFTFIDYGAGKGRALLMASDYSFKRIIGIEIGDGLQEIAQANIQRYSAPSQQCRDIKCVRADAGSAELPASPSVIFFYDPFRGPILHSVLDQIERSLHAYPRDVFIVYAFVDAPSRRRLGNRAKELFGVFDQQPWLRRFSEGRNDYDSFVVYASSIQSASSTS